MKNVLIISYYWPPASGPGVQRFLKMSKYLSEFGWNPHILTVKNGTYPSYDETLLNDVPENIKVHRTKTFEPYKLLGFLSGKKSKNFSVGLIDYQPDKSLVKKLSLYIRANYFIPDARMGWKPYAYKAARQIIKENKIDCIITTGPPHSTHLTGLKLKKKLNIPWIADLRDPWVNIYYNSIFPRTEKTREKDYDLESKVLKSADLTTVVSEGLQEEFYGRAKKIMTIFNGFDDIDMPEKTFNEPVEKFSVSYIGNFKPNQNVIMVWEALSELKEEEPGFSENLKILLTGNIDGTVLQAINKNNLQDNMEKREFVPHTEATKMMTKSSVLLFIIPKTRNNSLIITGKIFEYIASSTPILSVGPPDGDAAKILSNSGRDQMSDYENKLSFKAQLKKYYNHWKKNNGIAYKHPSVDLSQYTRKQQTRKLNIELNQLTDE